MGCCSSIPQNIDGEGAQNTQHQTPEEKKEEVRALLQAEFPLLFGPHADRPFDNGAQLLIRSDDGGDYPYKSIPDGATASPSSAVIHPWANEMGGNFIAMGGSNCTIFQARHRNEDDVEQLLVVKRLSGAVVSWFCSIGTTGTIEASASVDDIMEELRKTCTEADLMCRLQGHDNIVRTFGINTLFFDTPAGALDECYLIMEHFSAGTLEAFTRPDDERQALDLDSATAIVRQLVDVVRWMHVEHFIAHCDLKLDNVMLTTDWQDAEIKIKVIDFGEAVDVRQVPAKSNMTDAYHTPEHNSDDAESTKSDMWSIGLIALALVLQVDPHTPDEDGNMLRDTYAQHLGNLLENHGEHYLDARGAIQLLLNPVGERGWPAFVES